jgi:cobalt-zinc-cadmium efflux system protein
MAHSHNHSQPNYNRAFAIGVALNVAFVAVESVSGILLGSLALIADAGHNLSDVLSLLLAWGASLLAGTKSTERRTYGLRRTTIIASLLSSVLLLVALGAIAWEAIGRFLEPVAVSGSGVMLVAGIGVVINTVTALLFVRGRTQDLNINAAYLHMVADAGVSLGVVVAGWSIAMTGWLWLDPGISIAIVAIIAFSSWRVLRDSANLAVDGVPRNIDSASVSNYLLRQPGVTELHDLHIWAMSTTECALTVHLVMPTPTKSKISLQQVTKDLHDQFGIQHATLQIEREIFDHSYCEPASAYLG